MYNKCSEPQFSMWVTMEVMQSETSSLVQAAALLLHNKPASFSFFL